MVYIVTVKLEGHLSYVGRHSQVTLLKTGFEVHNPNDDLLRKAPVSGRDAVLV